MSDPEPMPEEQVLARADADELARKIGQLVPIHREVLVLCFVNGLTYDEIAQVVGIPEGTVKSRLSNAKRALRQLLKH